MSKLTEAFFVDVSIYNFGFQFQYQPNWVMKVEDHQASLESSEADVQVASSAML